MITLNNGQTTQEGTVICGTMRAYDLCPALMDEAELCGLNVDAHRLHWSIARTMPDSSSSKIEEENYLLDELFDMLDSIAPDGYYFGAHIGDGADYGWWPSYWDKDYITLD